MELWKELSFGTSELCKGKPAFTGCSTGLIENESKILQQHILQHAIIIKRECIYVVVCFAWSPDKHVSLPREEDMFISIVVVHVG